MALGVVLLGWFLTSLHWAELWTVLAELRLGWLCAAVGVLLVQYAIHAWRWGVLLRHVDDGIGPGLLWSSTAVLWAFNTVLPLRAGNLLRPLLIARERKLAYPTVLFATVAEYVCDAFGILVMVAWLMVLLPPDQAQGPLADALVAARYLTVGAILGFVLIVLLSTRGAHAGFRALVRPVPSRALRQRMTRLFDQLVEGMASVGRPLRFLQALVLTLGVWGTWLAGLVFTLWAFSLDLPLAAALFVEAALTLSMMVPQAPGFLGVFQVVTEEALTLFDAPVASAEGVALVFWSVCFVPITVIGLFEGARYQVRQDGD